MFIASTLWKVTSLGAFQLLTCCRDLDGTRAPNLNIASSVPVPRAVDALTEVVPQCNGAVVSAIYIRRLQLTLECKLEYEQSSREQKFG